MFGRRRISIRTQLMLLIVAVALPLLALIIFAAYLDLQRADAQTYETVGTLSQLTAAHAEQLLNDSHQLLAEVTQRPQVRLFDPAQCDPFLQEIPRLYNEYATITTVSRAGDTYCISLSPEIPLTEPATASRAHERWFQEVMQREQFTVSETLVSPVHGRWVAILAYPIYDLQGELAGALALSMNLVRYQAALERISLPTGSTITIVDGRGSVVARSEDAEQFVGQDVRDREIVRLVLEGRTHAARAEAIDGHDKFFGIAPIAGTDWTAYAGIPAEIAYAPVRTTLFQLATMAVAIVVIVTLLAFYLIREIEQPARALAQVAGEVAAGDFDRRAPTDGPTEFHAIAVQFNQMLAANSRHRAELEQYTRQLEAANQELESFAYSVSHDLRAPLRALVGFSAILIEEYWEQLDEDAHHYLRRIQAASERMGQLIDDLLNLARVSRVEMECEHVNLSRLVEQLSVEMGQRYPQRPVALAIMENCQAVGDPGLIRIALENLLDNAWKFTAKVDDARIEFGCADADSAPPIFYLRDNGDGFDMEYANKLFGTFQRLHTEKEFPGTGVGLATVQRVLNRHGGDVWAEAAVGQGATFYFTLPGTYQSDLVATGEPPGRRPAEMPAGQ
jgi:signal transduction histidine kinase